MLSSTTLENLSCCRYLTSRDVEWSDDHFKAQGIVRALKGESFKGNRFLHVDGKLRSLTAENPELAVEWFASSAAVGIDFAARTMLVPMPDSECTTNCGRDSKVKRLAEALVARVPKLGIWDGLRFRQAMQKSRENRQEEQVLFLAMHVTLPLPTGPLLILDDVCTRGAHARAAFRRLRASGATAGIQAISAARTTHDPNEPVFGIKVEQI